jgi:hypothetical protein
MGQIVTAPGTGPADLVLGLVARAGEVALCLAGIDTRSGW